VPSVLVVDDSEMDRRLLGGLLQNRGGWSVAFAVNGDDALTHFQPRPPDLVLTDLQMPGMDGLALVAAIKKDFPTTPVILMTGMGSEDIAAAALRRGAASYVPKKNLVEDLVGTMDRVLAAAREDRTHSRLMHHLTDDKARFDLPSDLEMIRSLVAFLQHNLRCMPLGDETERLRVSIAVEEALKNAYYHGSLEVGTGIGWPERKAIDQIASERLQQEPFCDRRIRVRASVSRAEAVFVIRDDGPGFNHSKLSGSLSLESTVHSPGRGIVLMRTIMDDVRFNHKGNEVTLVKRPRASREELADDTA
jgi:CheY-like chemotaxis protein